jgi:predicted ester cyclase
MHEFGTGREAPGADPVTDLVFGWFDAFPDLRGGIDNLVAGDGHVVIETLCQGTHEGALALPDGIVIPATGIRWTNPGCLVYRIVDGKLAEIHHYFDMARLLAAFTAAAA